MSHATERQLFEAASLLVSSLEISKRIELALTHIRTLRTSDFPKELQPSFEKIISMKDNCTIAEMEAIVMEILNLYATVATEYCSKDNV